MRNKPRTPLSVSLGQPPWFPASTLAIHVFRGTDLNNIDLTFLALGYSYDRYNIEF